MSAMLKYEVINNSALLQKLFYRTAARLTKTVNHYLSFYCSPPALNNNPQPGDVYFQTDDGRILPVLRDYRYSIKLGWKFFPELVALQILEQRKKLRRQEWKFFNEAIGTRTLQKPLSEIKIVADQAIKRCQNLFFADSAVPIPASNTIRSTVAACRKRHTVLLAKLKCFGVNLPTHRKPKILEIGYISGGYSLVAFEQLGFQVIGIDNYYGQAEDQSPLPQYIKNKVPSTVEFKIGDITHQTEFDNNEMDIIFSSSVLEHVESLEAAFSEMRRILKSGGLMIHSYNPFFCPNGGHALGILDNPWGHARVSSKDYLRYMDELRPFEAEIAKRWIASNLNKVPINRLQHRLAEQGFHILFWQQHAAPVAQQFWLTPQIMKECLEMNPGITLCDLITSTVTFAARKISE